MGLSAGAAFVAAAQVTLPDAVETEPLVRDAFSSGTLDRAGGALPPTLWRGADPQILEYLLAQLPARLPAPSLGEAMKRTLLSPGSAPDAAAPSLGGKKLLALARAGFVDDARTVASLSTVGRGDPWTGQAEAVADLLDGDIVAACRRNANLKSGRDEIFWVKLRVLCYAQAGEGDAADLTLNILREQAGFSGVDEAYLTAAATGAAPKTPPAAETALQYAIAKKMGVPLAPGLLGRADGGVLVAIARDGGLDMATRIDAAERAAAMGVMAIDVLAGIMNSANFDVTQISNAAVAAIERRRDPLTDALLYQSIQEMNAPEFIRDKAQRIAAALGVAGSFYRAYALSILYADEINALEGVIISPEEAVRFATARMAIGDSVGAGQWLSAMVGLNQSVSALPEPLAMTFIDRVNLLAVLDPQTAARVARAAGVSLLSDEPAYKRTEKGHDDTVLMARILEAAFDAAVEGKAGQAGLAALAAANGSAASGGEIETVVITQSLRAAGMPELSRRHQFEQAWAASFTPPSLETSGAGSPQVGGGEDDGGLSPRVKPRRAQ